MADQLNASSEERIAQVETDLTELTRNLRGELAWCDHYTPFGVGGPAGNDGRKVCVKCERSYTTHVIRAALGALALARSTSKDGLRRSCMALRATDPPTDCDFPFCGCDPGAEAAVQALRECDALVKVGTATYLEQCAADLALARSTSATLLKERDEARQHVMQLNTWIREAVEAAAPFQEGGELAHALMLGKSTVVDGMRWLLAERTRLAKELDDLRWTVDNTYTIARREAKRQDQRDTRDRWGHVRRICEERGGAQERTVGVLRGEADGI